MSQISSQTQSDEDEIDRKIRELRRYSYEDDADSSVNIVAQPGSTVVVNPDSEPTMVRLPKWAKVAAGVVGAIAGLAAIIKTAYEALTAH